MSTTVHVALVPRGAEVDMGQVTSVAAALSIQVTRDFSPVWGISATVAAFAAPKDVPIGYWPIYILDPKKLPPDEGGVHLDRHNQPYSLIKGDDGWSLDASHECLEMLVDPSGNKLQANPLLDQAAALGQPSHQVQYLVEVCDPIEDAQYGYQINGVMVSDFITPRFYDAFAAAGVRYDFTGAIKKPRQVLNNGYISWIDPVTGDAMQLKNFLDETGTAAPEVVNLSQNADFVSVLANEALRPAVDRVTRTPDYGVIRSAAHRAELSERRTSVSQAASARAGRLTEDIDRVLQRQA